MTRESDWFRHSAKPLLTKDLQDFRDRELPPVVQAPVYSKWDDRFMRMAAEVAGWSKDPQVKVGAVVVSPDRRRFTAGYNGFPIGVSDDARLDGDERNGLTVHAELNAILNARCDLTGWTIYTTRAPCAECAKAIIQAGVRRVVTPPLPSKSSWLESCERGYHMLLEAGVQIQLTKGERP